MKVLVLAYFRESLPNPPKEDFEDLFLIELFKFFVADFFTSLPQLAVGREGLNYISLPGQPWHWPDLFLSATKYNLPLSVFFRRSFVL